MMLRIALVCLVLAACATTEAYEKILQSWVGSHVDDLVRAWGPPHGSHTFKDGSRAYLYVRSRTVALAAPQVYRPVVIPDRGAPSGARTAFVEESIGEPRLHAFTCETTFEIDPDGIVRKWTWRGNDCVARPQ